MPFRCATCSELHDGLPDMGCNAPDCYLAVPEEERAECTRLTEDLCTVMRDGRVDYFIRGVVLVPVRGEEEPFGLGVWVSQSEENFERYVKGEAKEPTFGWLSNELAHSEVSTTNLKTRVHFREGGLRPTLELEPTDHPLAVEQRTGITLERAWAIVHRYMPS